MEIRFCWLTLDEITGHSKSTSASITADNQFSMKSFSNLWFTSDTLDFSNELNHCSRIVEEKCNIKRLARLALLNNAHSGTSFVASTGCG